MVAAWSPAHKVLFHPLSAVCVVRGLSFVLLG